ncbi:MAG: AMP-binding protein [Pseudomonadota bacterium]
MNPAEWLARAAQHTPEAPALLQGTAVIADYAGFAQRVAGIAAAFADAFQLAAGKRVAIFMKNDAAYLEALYAIWHAGLVAVPINAKLHPREAAWILQDADTRLVLASPDLASDLKAALRDADLTSCQLLEAPGPAFDRLREHAPAGPPAPMVRDTLIWLFYTSGTTGRPKGVMLSAGNIAAMAYTYFIDVDAVHGTDTALYAAPLSHGAGLYSVMHVLRGARHAIPPSGGFDAAEILALAPQLCDVHLFAAPTMVRRLVDGARASGSSGEGIRTIVYGGGPMYRADIVEAVAVMGPRFVQIYGQGESPMTITALSRAAVADREHSRWRERLASVGRAQSCVDVRVVGENRQLLGPGETGEVEVRGATVMLGYWQNPGATARTMRDGWLATGDLGFLDADGFLTLVDRSKDMIISGGTNIYPREIEEVLLEHPSVHEAAVIGRPHADWGEEVVAFITPAAGASFDPGALDRHCLERIARFKRPKAYFTLGRLPKNNYGKILKTELRRILAEHDGDGGSRS